MAEIKLNCNAMMFDIDYINGVLYVVNDKDEITKYAIDKILSDIMMLKKN